MPSLVMDKSLDLLAKAALAPLDVAVASWLAWRAAYDIDTTPWNEVRMLGAVAARIDELEPNSPIRPRVLGIRKFLWVQSQICLKNCESGLAALAQSRVPMMLMKGAARTARDPLSVQERLIRDVDVLVPLAQQSQAFDALQNAGWSIAHTPWQIQMHELGPISSHHAWAFSKGQSEIDLHHVSNHLNRLRGDDDGFWARALPTVWQGKAVFIPSAADALLIALIHGVRWSQDRSADWTVDACALLDEGAMQWDVFMQEVRARQIQAHALTGLAYLRDALQKFIPSEVMTSLLAEATSDQWREFEGYASVASPETLEQSQTAVHMAFERAKTKRRTLRGMRPPPARAKLQGTLTAPASSWVRLPLYDLTWRTGWIDLQIKINRLELTEQVRMKIELIWPGLQSSILHFDVGPRAFPLLRVGVPEVLLDLRSIQTLGMRVSTNGSTKEFQMDYFMDSHEDLSASMGVGQVAVKLVVANT